VPEHGLSPLTRPFMDDHESLMTSMDFVIAFAQLHVGEGIAPGLMACKRVLAAVCIIIIYH
jgi:hypothetical protein